MPPMNHSAFFCALSTGFESLVAAGALMIVTGLKLVREVLTRKHREQENVVGERDESVASQPVENAVFLELQVQPLRDILRVVGRKKRKKQRKTREMLATRWTSITHQANS